MSIKFDLIPGTERKSTGSYYTPPALVQELIKSALEPVLEERLKEASTREEKERVILSLKVCDPACGSGHFLLAAARRLGLELARVRTGEEHPSVDEVRHATREVIQHCLYGVDKNPLAVDLCKVALWLEGACRGEPLTFLDHRIKCGDSLVGVFDLKVLEEGIPDDAFKALPGDDKAVVRELKKENKAGRKLFAPIFQIEKKLEELSRKFRELEELPDSTIEELGAKAERYKEIVNSPEWWILEQACNLWTAAFFMPKTKDTRPFVPTSQKLFQYLQQPKTADGRLMGQVGALAEREALRFFHWPLEFPEVFYRRTANSEQGTENSLNHSPFPTHRSPAAKGGAATRHSPGPEGRNHSPLATRHPPNNLPLTIRYSPLGGFDVVLGNPPWEMMQLEEVQFFAARAPEIAQTRNSAERKKLINKLKETKPALYEKYLKAKYYQAAINHYVRKSGRFPLTAYGKLNTYSVFAELALRLTGPEGRAGIIVPTGIATDDTNKYFFSELVENGYLASLFDFKNHPGLFPAVAPDTKFSLLTLRNIQKADKALFAFFLTDTTQLKDWHRVFTVTKEDLELLNPNTKTTPIFRTSYDAELTKKIYRRVPVLVNEKTGENPWGVSFKQGLFNMSSDSHLFRTRKELLAEGYELKGNIFVKSNGDVYLPLYEAKMMWLFDHRFGTYEGLDRRKKLLPTPTEKQYSDPSFIVIPWYWVPAREVQARVKDWTKIWLIGFRNVTDAMNERTAIFSLIPLAGVGHSTPLIFSSEKSFLILCLLANLSAIVFDYVTRQKVGGTNFTFHYVKQLPILPPETYTTRHSPFATRYLLFAVPRILELTYTAWDIKPFADDIWAEADEDLRSAIRKQWEENQRTANSEQGTENSLNHSPFPTRHSPPDWLEIIYSLNPDNPNQDACPLPPFKWNETRRAYLRAELDAFFAKLYGLTEEELRYILDPQDVFGPDFPGETFRVLKEKELKQFGEYKTKKSVLKAWKQLDLGGSNARKT